MRANLNDLSCDVLIVGTGASALYCALNLREDLNIIMVTKSHVRESNSYLAQGGISTALDHEDIDLFVQDTMKAGNYKNDIKSVEILCKESRENIDNLIALETPFDKKDGSLEYTREGAHRVNRIVHCSDSTGKTVVETLLKNVKNSSNITILQHTALIDIISENNKVCGAILRAENLNFNIYSKVAILATGGIGGLFKNSTNQRTLTGDSIALALAHNIALKDVGYIQFHPTALYDESSDSRRFLISESVRGEGGKLFNSKGERFIDELLPRDVVAKAINKEIVKTGIPYVFLDISFMGKTYIKERFPMIYNECLLHGIDITEAPIPVSPAQHYFMGGIKVNHNSETSMKDLYAVGESSCTGVHGSNRLASNSLLEALVFSKRAADKINLEIDKKSLAKASSYENNSKKNSQLDNHLLVIEELKKRNGDLYDELFSYRQDYIKCP